MRNTNLIPTWCPHPSAPQEALQYLILKLRFQAEFGLSAYYLSRVIGKGQKKVKSTKCKVKTELSKQIPQVLSSSRPPDSALLFHLPGAVVTSVTPSVCACSNSLFPETQIKWLPRAQSLLDGHSSSRGKFPREMPSANSLSHKHALIHRHNIPQGAPQPCLQIKITETQNIPSWK